MLELVIIIIIIIIIIMSPGVPGHRPTAAYHLPVAPDNVFVPIIACIRTADKRTEPLTT